MQFLQDRGWVLLICVGYCRADMGHVKADILRIDAYTNAGMGDA
jgi:hypothetical protein|eukprot:COSAG01_NODE_2549_length_7465_cov_5.036383_3_plen_44_part_00